MLFEKSRIVKKCKKNGRLVQPNNRLRTKNMAVFLEITILMTYLLNMNKYYSQNEQYIV